MTVYLAMFVSGFLSKTTLELTLSKLFLLGMFTFVPGRWVLFVLHFPFNN